jgi:hypothetical protein
MTCKYQPTAYSQRPLGPTQATRYQIRCLVSSNIDDLAPLIDVIIRSVRNVARGVFQPTNVTRRCRPKLSAGDCPDRAVKKVS